jgi:hypothetical protein
MYIVWCMLQLFTVLFLNSSPTPSSLPLPPPALSTLSAGIELLTKSQLMGQYPIRKGFYGILTITKTFPVLFLL